MRGKSETLEENALAEARRLHESFKAEACSRRAAEAALLKREREIEKLRREIASHKVCIEDNYCMETRKPCEGLIIKGGRGGGDAVVVKIIDDSSDMMLLIIDPNSLFSLHITSII